MSLAYVIHAEEDREFVRDTLLTPLAMEGMDRWLSRHLLGPDASSEAVARAVQSCRVAITVVSRRAAADVRVRDDVEIALERRCPMLVALFGGAEPELVRRLSERLAARPIVDFGDPKTAGSTLRSLLPADDHASVADGYDGVAERIRWSEEIYSDTLHRALGRHDHARASALVASLVQHVQEREVPYPEDHARKDLTALRNDRQFKLMRAYAEAVLAGGTNDPEVRKQLGQALIELGEYDAALGVLRSVIDDASPDVEQVAEARGLIGRLYKQQYVNDPAASGAAVLLQRAIAAYESVYDNDKTRIWHGVNAVSCRLRAHRDVIPDANPERARRMAREILQEVERRKRAGNLYVWDYATRVEAFLALGDYQRASDALDDYLMHPEMRAFEVSSTYRQFDEILQLAKDPQGKPLLDRLWRAVERFRAGGISRFASSASGGGSAGAGTSGARSLIIRVTDPDWEACDVPDLVIEARLGTVVSAYGSEESVKRLLADPQVISINESRPASGGDCARSVPFIGVSPSGTYPSASGHYSERGGNALIAVIDNGIDVLHETFLDGAGQSRIVGIWDQTDQTGPAPNGFTTGTYHSDTDIARYVQTKTTPPGLGRNRNGHGTHVASIAAGRKVGTFFGGVAPEAKLLIVVSAAQGPIGYSSSHLAALAFIDAEARRRDLPVVVNVSQGMNAGAHDGRSALEAGFDGFSGSGRTPGRVVVKSAGNERNKSGHALVTMLPNSVDDLRWNRSPFGAGKDRLELWWSAADELEFVLSDPAGKSTASVTNAQPQVVGAFPSGVPYTLQFTKRHIDNGDSLLEIELGNGSTSPTPGLWALAIVSQAVQEGVLHAWIERGLGEPSSFVNHASEDVTLTVPGTGFNVITVGAVSASNPIRVGGFSSYGLTRDQRRKPDVAAPGIDVIAASGGTSTGVRADSGTSMAAPHVTGAIALLLSRLKGQGRPIPSSSQIASAICQKTRNGNGRHDRGQGYGVVDVAALLAAF